MVAVAHALGQAFQANALELTRDVAACAEAWRLGISIQDFIEDLIAVAADEGRPAGEADVEDHPDRPEVGPAVQTMGFTANLLGRHESRSAGDFAPLEPLKILIDRQAEVGDKRVAAGVDQDVRRFQIAVHQPRVVSVIDGLADADDDLDEPLVGQPLVLQEVGQGAAVDEFEHDIERLFALRADVEHAHDRRVTQVRGQPRLSEQ